MFRSQSVLYSSHNVTRLIHSCEERSSLTLQPGILHKEVEQNMAEKKNLTEKINHPRMRRIRQYGLTDSILSNTTVYLNPYAEDGSNRSAEEVAMYAVVAKYFNDGNS